jgi:hypothetical protein
MPKRGRFAKVSIKKSCKVYGKHETFEKCSFLFKFKEGEKY